MRKLNFRIQSLFLVMAFILSIASIIKIADALFWLLILQLFVGFVQFIVAMKLISMKRTRTTLLEIYMASAVIFLVLFIGGMDELMQTFRYGFVVIPWCLAALFWYISFKLYNEEVK